MFYCYTECGSLSIFKFLTEYYNTRNITYDWYNDVYQVIIGCSASDVIRGRTETYHSIKDNYIKQPDNVKLPTYPKGLLDIFSKYYPVEWLKDGISEKTMDKYNIRYCSEWNKIIIPHYDIKDNLVGIRGRALNPEEIEAVGKYAPIWLEKKCISHPLSLNLYGLNFNIESIKRAKVVYVFEAEKSCMQLDSFNIPNLSVASCGANFNKHQLDILLKNCAPIEVILCYDSEEEKGKNEYFYKLYEKCRKYTHYVNMSFIYDREGLLPHKASPSDCGEEIFKRLVQKRVHVS